MAGPLPPLTSTKTRLTNPGIPLHNEYRGGESDSIREVPPEWRAALDLKVTEQSVPTDEPLFELTDEILASKLEQTFTSERKLRTTRKPAGVFTLLERFTNKDKEFGLRTRTFHFEDDFGGVTNPSAVKDVSTRNFGNKHFEEIVEEIPGVFDAEEFSVERPVVTPEDFRALLQEHEHSITAVGTAVEPTLSAGDIKKTDTQQDLFLHRTSDLFIDLSELPSTITNKKTNKFKQVETVSRILESASTTPAVPTTTRDVSFTKLGDGTALEERTDVDTFFPNQVYSRERGISTPQDFRALLQEESVAASLAGIAALPSALGPGIVSIADEQVDVFNHRITSKLIDLSSLPAVNINFKTNRFKQVVQESRFLVDDSTTPAVPTALRDVEFTKLGDGTALEVVNDVDSVFDQKAVTTELPDLLPDIFKATLPEYIHENVISGASVTDPPVLATGDFFKSETRETEFTKKVVTRGRAGLSLPQSVTAFRRIGGEQFGAEITKMDGFLDDSEPSVETGLDVVSSKVTDLGNGTWFRETEKLDTAVAWPTLDGQNFDKEMQTNALTEEQTVDSSFTPATPGVGDYWVESKKTIDQYHAKRVKLTRTPSATDFASALIEEVDGPFQFPGLVYLVSGGAYRRQASAQLCQHIIRTWWMSSATKPTRTLPGGGGDVEVQDIIMDDIIISTLNDVTRLEYSGMCLHDAITTFGTFVYAATVPSVTAYIAMIGTEIVVGASIEPTDIPNLWKIQTKSVVAR